MLKTVAFIFVVTLSAALASDVVLDIDLDKQDQIQIGEPGRAVAGSYSFIDSDGKDHTVKYIADEKGYRVWMVLLPTSSLSPPWFNPINIFNTFVIIPQATQFSMFQLEPCHLPVSNTCTTDRNTYCNHW